MKSIKTDTIWSDIEKIRKTSPLVHNITNYVVMNNTANALLAIGASPVMAHSVEEVQDMVNIASSLVINVGTLSPHWNDAMKLAMIRAKERGIPVVLDPVGAGATPFRNATIEQLLALDAVTLIRGNGSEIMALVDANVMTKGVDSMTSSDRAFDAAKILSNQFDCTVCISGETDYIVSENSSNCTHNGNTMMARVTGMGCTATAICGAFLAVNSDRHMATAHAMATMGIAGEIAHEKADGPGTLQLHFLDALYNLDHAAIDRRLNVN